MSNGFIIRVFFSSTTIGGLKGRKGLEPVCYSCEKSMGVARDSEVRVLVPSEVMPLFFSAELAAKELGVGFEAIDINRMSIVQKLSEKTNRKPVPRVSVGEDFLVGSPTKNEIIRFYHQISP
ncbi:MAG: hypothetical protein RTV41_14350 [Candidatus Thorarchaeota archaeon]